MKGYRDILRIDADAGHGATGAGHIHAGRHHLIAGARAGCRAVESEADDPIQLVDNDFN
jgi:hypothetical protein